MRIFNILIILCLFTNLSLKGYSQSIKISKEHDSDPTEVCNLSTLKYIATVSGLPTGVSVDVTWTPVNGSTSETGNTSSKVKWEAGTSAGGK